MKHKPIVFVDRDGTIIQEPPGDFQVDSLEKLEFRPGAISALRELARAGYELVLVTNQDGLGTDSFPEERFWPAHRKMLRTLEGEGVEFAEQLIDRTFEHEQAPTRKPGTGMFGRYLTGEYDLSACYVIGDRATDVELARNLGARAVLYAEPEAGHAMLAERGLDVGCFCVSDSWEEIADRIRMGLRRSTVHRKTRETDITVSIDLDRREVNGNRIDTGLRFLDHMLDQLNHHGGVALSVVAEGDLEVDEHHTVEDIAIVLGEAVGEALGSKAGIERYGYALPMDDCRALALIDFGGRVALEWSVEFTRERVGDVPTELFRHFFHSFCCAARCNLHVEARGRDNHHKAEAVFKAFARALRMAAAHTAFGYEVPSSKGVL